MSDNREETVQAQSAPEPAPVPFAVHQCEVSFYREILFRLIWVIVLLIVALFASNVYWLNYEAQYDKISYAQDGEGLNNICTGTQGAIVFGTEGEIQEEAFRQIEGVEGS